MTEAQELLMKRAGLKLGAEIKFTKTFPNLMLLHLQHIRFKTRRYTLFIHVFTGVISLKILIEGAEKFLNPFCLYFL